ncbi:MAG: hypothetical protein K2Y51_26105 [Gammaproteobacteria bacterium]|nr:hypothetical protein [Gammaproteobacteria bacterium]
MRTHRSDGNQDEIIARYQANLASVIVVSRFASWDLVVGAGGVTDLVEVKDPRQPKSNRKLTPKEDDLHQTWKGSKIVIVETFDDVDRHVASMRERGRR